MDWHPNCDTTLDVEWYHCGFCGAKDICGNHVMDHCHVTGLMRGILCRSCNIVEAHRANDPRWISWRRTAPMLKHRFLHGLDYLRNGLGLDDVLSRPMEELLA